MGPTSMSTTLMILLSQLAVAAPMLAVYIVGIVLAVLRLRRAPRAMTFAIIGLGVLLTATVGANVAQAYFIGQGRVATVVGLIGIGGGVLRAVGMGLVVAAVFAGRERVMGFEVAPPSLAPQPPLATVSAEHAMRP